MVLLQAVGGDDQKERGRVMSRPERAPVPAGPPSGRYRRVGMVAGRVAALLAAFLWGFFVAFNVLFSDVIGREAQLGALGFVFLAYGLLGVVFGFLGPRTGVRWAYWLAPPGILAAAFSLSDDPGRLLYALGVAVAVAVGSLAGSFLGGLAGRQLQETLLGRHRGR